MNEVRTTRWLDQPNDEDTAVNIVSDRWPRPIATVLSYASRDIGPGRAERDKHARLIAAAPEMLDALRQAREWLEGWASATHQLEVINAAIASAESSS